MASTSTTKQNNSSNLSGNGAGKEFDIFENFLNIYKNHRTHTVQTPDNIVNFNRLAMSDASSTPRRICGDWNSKVKLLRYRSNGPILGLHFSSDYSHHFGGYKAKVVIKDGKWCLSRQLQITSSVFFFQLIVQIAVKTTVNCSRRHTVRRTKAFPFTKCVFWIDFFLLAFFDSVIKVLRRSTEIVQRRMLSICFISRSRLAHGATSVCRHSRPIGDGYICWRATVSLVTHRLCCQFLAFHSKLYCWQRAPSVISSTNEPALFISETLVKIR